MAKWVKSRSAGWGSDNG